MDVLKMVVLAAVSALAVSCGSRSVKPVDIDWEDGKGSAVVLLGYYDSFASLEASPEYDELQSRYPWMAQAQKVVRKAPGALYLRIPRDPAGTPAMVLCGIGDFDSLIPATDTASVQRIESDAPEPLWSFDTASCESLGFSVEIREGMPFVKVKYEDLIGSYISDQEINIPEGENPVSGLDGFCKGVFIGDIGQDLNPVLCVLMEDGTVKICNLLEAVAEGFCALSGSMEGLDGIVGFTEDVAGVDFAEYSTVYAVDSRGNRFEMPQFIAPGTYYCMPDNGGKIEVRLTSDFHMVVSWLSDSGVVEKTMSGRFSQSGSIDDNLTFTYTVLHRGITPCWAPGEAKVSHADGSSYSVSAEAPLSFPDGSVFQSGYGPDMEPEYDGEEYDETP